MYLPFDFHQLKRLAKRDLARACEDFLESAFDRLPEVLETLREAPPQSECPDLCPFLCWLGEQALRTDTRSLPEQLIAKLLEPERIGESPLELSIKHVHPGDTLEETLLRRLSMPPVVLPSEGDRLVALDEVTFLVAAHLGYLRSSTDTVRAKRVDGVEQASMQQGRTLLSELSDASTIATAPLHVLRFRFEQLLLTPNHAMHRTLARLETLPPETRHTLFEAVVHYQRRLGLPPGRSPSISLLQRRLETQGIPLELEDLSRLLYLAARLFERFLPDPDVASGIVSCSLEELEEYLQWDLSLKDLPRYRSSLGVRFLNQALTSLAAGQRSTGWPPHLEAELVEFREGFLKRIHLKPVQDLLAIDPARLLKAALSRSSPGSLPKMGDPARLQAAWTEFLAELHALEDEATSPYTHEVAVGDGQEADSEFHSAQDFFKLEDDSLVTVMPTEEMPVEAASGEVLLEEAPSGSDPTLEPLEEARKTSGNLLSLAHEAWLETLPPLESLEEVSQSLEDTPPPSRLAPLSSSTDVESHAFPTPTISVPAGADSEVIAKELEELVRVLEGSEGRPPLSSYEEERSGAPFDPADPLQAPREVGHVPAHRRPLLTLEDLAPPPDTWETPTEHPGGGPPRDKRGSSR